MNNQDQLRAFLDRKVEEYNRPSFIKDDPISIPHRYTKKQDIEIAGFFAAIFAWGNRTTIIRKTHELMQAMDNAPHQFVLQHTDNDLRRLLDFRHRTFNATDLLYCIDFFTMHYSAHDSLEDAFLQPYEGKKGMAAHLSAFYHYFFSLPDPLTGGPVVPGFRTRKHIATPERNSSCKRLNMFLRWMVRRDDKGVDFGLWNRMDPARLICPLDVHVARVARRLDLLTRPQTDWTAALELTDHLCILDPHDPVKYDFALFGLGVMEKF